MTNIKQFNDHKINNLYGIDLEKCLELDYHVYLKNKSGEYLECNLAQAKRFGLKTGNDVLGRMDRDFDFFPSNQVQIVTRNDLEVMSQEKPKMVIELCTFVNRKPQPMFSIKFPFYNQAGKILGVFGMSAPLDENNVFATTLPQVMLAQQVNSVETAQAEQKFSCQAKVSRREKECLYYLAQGMTAKEIARVLSLSPRTIEFYIENMKKKFNCSNRIELIAKAFSLIDVDLSIN